MPSILMIGVETGFRKSVKGHLKERFQFFSSGSLKEGIRNIQKNQIDLVIVQIDSKFLKSISWLTKIGKTRSLESGELSVLLLADVKYVNNPSFQELSKHPLVQDIYWMQGPVEENGHNHIFLKTLDIFLEKNLTMLKHIRAACRNALTVEMLSCENLAAMGKAADEPHLPQGRNSDGPPPSFFTGESKALALFRSNLETLSKRTEPVLMLGSDGLEQEKIAGFIHHALARRAKNYFGEVDLAKVPKHLQDSILFGLEEKNLPGFSDLGSGLFEKCRNGTIFIRHIDQLGWEAQSKLFQVFRDGFFIRAGEKVTIKCKTLMTTEADLEKLVDRGLFRQNLHSHLGPGSLVIPNLVQRRLDLPQVIDRYTEWFSKNFSKPLKVTPQFKSELSRKRLPGQIDELLTLLHTSLALASHEVDSDIIATAEELILAEAPARDSKSRRNSGTNYSAGEYNPGVAHEMKNFLKEGSVQKTLPLFQNVTPEKSHYSLEELEREYINITLRSNHHNISETALVLGISRKTLYKKIKEYNIAKSNAS